MSPKNLRKSKRKWIYGGIAVVVVLGIAIPEVLSHMHSGSASSITNTYTVGYGPVVEYIGTSGSIEIPNQVNLQFQSGNTSNGPSGQVTSLPITVGQVVKAGQVLATLNPASAKLSVIQAQSSVAQAQGNLATAEANLTKDLQGTAQSTLTQDRINVQKAQQSLAAAQLQYQNQLAVYNDRTSAKQQVTNAENTLKMAEQQAKNTVSSQQSIQSAEQKVTADENTIASDQLTIKSAQQTVTAAQQSLAAAQENLKTDQNSLATDQQTLALDQAKYGTITSSQVQQAYQNYQTEEQLAINWQTSGFTGSNPYTTYASNANANYQLLNTGYTTLQSDQNTVTKDQTTITADKNAITQDQNAMTQDQNAVTKDQAQLALDQKQLATDQAALADAKTSSNYSSQQTQLQIQQDKQAVQAAIQTYNDRTSQLSTLDNSKITIAQDQISLKSAEATLNSDLQPADATTIAAARASVSNAQAALKSSVAQLQSAQLTEQETVLRAPIDGIITAVDVANGAPVSGSTVIATMEANTKNESLVQLTVSQSQIESVKVGNPITLTVDALPNATFNGKITQVYPVPTTSSNVTNYTVIANVNNSSGDLKPGMSVNVEIQVANQQHVLTVPAISLVNFGSMEGVYVVGTRPQGGSLSGHHHVGGGSGSGTSTGTSSGTSNGSFGGSGSSAASAKLPSGVYFQPVQVGIMGTSTVQITGGLTAGQKIMLVPPGSVLSATTSGSTGRGFGPFGGGGGGGRRGGGQNG